MSPFKNMIYVKRKVLPDSQHRLEDRFVLGMVIGQSIYGQLSLAEERKTGKTYVCKTMQKSVMTSEDQEYIKKEIEILRACADNDQTVDLIGTYEDSHNVYLILGRTGGQLLYRIRSKGSYCEKDARDLFRQMLEIVKYLHSKHIVHRDLKPDNFIFFKQGDEVKLVLADFELADFLPPDDMLTEEVGDTEFMSPEMMKGRYNEKTDMYSLGVVLSLLLSGDRPYYGRAGVVNMPTSSGTVMSRMDQEPWPKVSQEAKNLVKRLLDSNHAARPSAEQALAHPWIVNESVAKDVSLAESVFGGMKRYEQANVLKKRAFQIMSSNLKESDVAKFKELFARIDKDQSGFVSIDELKQAMVDSGTDISEEELEHVVRSYDVDGNNTIELTEFVSALSNVSKLNTVENIRAAFATFDKDGSGSITADEVLAALQDTAGMDINKAKEIVKDADKNGNGVIEWEEFYVMMMKHDDELKRAISHRKRIGISS